MNWAEIRGDWAGMAQLLKTQWPQLREEDWERLGGSREELIGALVRCYGLRRGDAEEEVCKFEKEARFPGAVK